MKCFAVGSIMLLVFVSMTSVAQKKVAILGSSTAEGTGASPIDSSWVARLQASFRINMADGIDTLVDNRALGGYTTYHSMPTGNSVPNRPAPDEARNVSYVLNDIPRADVVVINYPSNDIVYGYSAKETMDNLRKMFELLNANGVTTYISTTQPRSWLSDEQRTIQRQLVDSIRINFGLYAINFWDDLVTTDGSNRIRSEVDYGDGIHVNNLGHRLLFQRVQQKNILSPVVGAPLPLKLRNWQAVSENTTVKLIWSTVNEEPNTFFEVQRSADGYSFETLFRQNAIGNDAEYSWSDAFPLRGNSFYRLKITESARTSFSRVLPVTSKDQERFTSKSYVNGSFLQIEIETAQNIPAVFSIFNLSGTLVKKQRVFLNRVSNFAISISDLAAGSYILRIDGTDGNLSIQRFIKIK